MHLAGLLSPCAGLSAREKKVNSHGKPPESRRDNTHGLHGGRFCALLIMKIKIKKDEDCFSNIRQSMDFL